MRQIYDLELEKIKQVVLDNQYQKILLQMPEGMLDDPLKTVLKELSSLEVQAVVVGDPSYGYCDLAIDLGIRLGCNLLIHFGHTSFGFENKIQTQHAKIDILEIPALVTFEISSYFTQLSRKLEQLKWADIGLVATAQHLKNLEELKSCLDSKKINNVVLRTGQILGCHLQNAMGFPKDVDGIISLHAGHFHTHGLLLSTVHPILQLNPFTGEINLFSQEERNKLIRKRHAIIQKARAAETWGVLGSSKLGQYNPGQMSRVEKILTSNNKFIVQVIGENLDPHHLLNLPWVDAWVDTACPRLAVDDQISFEKPIVTFKEFLYLFDEVSWERILTTGFF
ncbi:MAG: diphthamide biosynthesis enzyme Dph2 [Candidatus Heimdallarchaeota archaeon]|nr:MAG: diphthamide biosynthesis enzyme Dph2 [Candidatus Heimdallarchaeota archaeon]